MTPPKNIIIRMPNWLGDAVMATPILADVRNHWKKANITAMCKNNVAPLIEQNPYVTDIFSFKRPNRWIHRKQHLNIIERIRRGEYDLGILLTNSLSSAWWFWRGHVQHSIGYSSRLRNFFLDEAIPFPKTKEKQHQVLTYKMLLEPLGIPISETDPKLYLSDSEHEEAKKILERHSIIYGTHTIIGINPGAAYGTAKCWPPDRFQGVTERLLEDDPDVRVIFFADHSGAQVVNTICSNLPGDRVVNLAGKTSIRELMSLIKCCTAFLTNDSGPMHIASALRTPLLALFGSTNEVKTGPTPIGKVIHKHVECSPCYKRVCPIDFRCMMRIEVDEVYQQLKTIINEKTTPVNVNR